ncbi:prorelaxin-like [Rhincodon typus]|uniref:prorelaxin-like n=1 Tax=Rhincodon typus TaxID=259920 RepID=UPI0020307245|nr:prorelaxin-like [Rhincodon typus]
MKYLVSVLATGLLLSFFTNSINAEEEHEMKKLCGRDFVEKLLQLCVSMRARIYHPYDPFQPSADNSVFKERISDRSNIDQLGSNYGQHPFFRGRNHYERTPDDFNKFSFHPDGYRNMHPAFPHMSHHPKLKGRQLEIKCCKVGCTTNEILQRCKQ